MSNRDLRSEPFRNLVTLGESNTWGAWASSEEYEWPNLLARLINEFQETPVTLHNKGIGANVISKRCPCYEQSVKPSAMERYREDVIALKPDLVAIAYGLNDMRGGTPVEIFREDLETITRDVQKETGAVVVLTSAYYQSEYGKYPPWFGTTEAHELYNQCIEQTAEKLDCLYADFYGVCKGADWMVHPDTVHLTDLGFLLYTQRVFEVLAQNSSCLSHKAMKGSIAASDEAARRYAEAMSKSK